MKKNILRWICMAVNAALFVSSYISFRIGMKAESLHVAVWGKTFFEWMVIVTILGIASVIAIAASCWMIDRVDQTPQEESS